MVPERLRDLHYRESKGILPVRYLTSLMVP